MNEFDPYQRDDRFEALRDPHGELHRDVVAESMASNPNTFVDVAQELERPSPNTRAGELEELRNIIDPTFLQPNTEEPKFKHEEDFNSTQRFDRTWESLLKYATTHTPEEFRRQMQPRYFRRVLQKTDKPGYFMISRKEVTSDEYRKRAFHDTDPGEPPESVKADDGEDLYLVENTRPPALASMDNMLKERPDLSEQLYRRIEEIGGATISAEDVLNAGKERLRASEQSLHAVRSRYVGDRHYGHPHEVSAFAYAVETNNHEGTRLAEKRSRAISEEDVRTRETLPLLMDALHNLDRGPNYDYEQYMVHEDLIPGAIEQSWKLMITEDKLDRLHLEASLFQQTHDLSKRASELAEIMRNLESSGNGFLHSTYTCAREQRAELVQAHNLILQRWQMARLLSAPREENGRAQFFGRHAGEIMPDRTLVWDGHFMYSDGTVQEFYDKSNDQEEGFEAPPRYDGNGDVWQETELPRDLGGAEIKLEGHDSRGSMTRAIGRALGKTRLARRRPASELLDSHTEAMAQWWQHQESISNIRLAQRTGEDALRAFNESLGARTKELAAYDDKADKPEPPEAIQLPDNATPDQIQRAAESHRQQVEAYRQAVERYNQGRQEIIDKIEAVTVSARGVLYDVFFMGDRSEKDTSSLSRNAMATGTIEFLGQKGEWHVTPRGQRLWHNRQPYDPVEQYRSEPLRAVS